MSEQLKAPRAVQYTGPAKTFQMDAKWLEPGAIITSPLGLIRSLSELPDFQIIDTTLETEPQEPVVAGDVDDIEEEEEV